jgi:hypothetical protein
LRVTTVDLAYDGLIPGNGYYGPDGGRAVSEAIFLKIKDEITAACQRVNWMRPLQPSQVNVCVLVPEMLIRFIAEDRNISVNQAAEVLEKSTAYGNALFSDSNEPRQELLGAFDDVSDESDDGSNDTFLDHWDRDSVWTNVTNLNQKDCVANPAAADDDDDDNDDDDDDDDNDDDHYFD